MTQTPIGVKAEEHPLIAEARAVGYWHDCFAAFERLLIAHGHKALDALSDRALAARINAERECRDRLVAYRAAMEGAL